MQRLMVVDRLYSLVVSGAKTSTIRWRETPIVPGPMTYVCQGDPAKTVVVLVTRCTDMPLAEVAASVGKAADWPDPVMLAGIREHYPEIALSDVVQVVEHLTPQQTAALASRPGSCPVTDVGTTGSKEPGKQ